MDISVISVSSWEFRDLAGKGNLVPGSIYRIDFDLPTWDQVIWWAVAVSSQGGYFYSNLGSARNAATQQGKDQ